MSPPSAPRQLGLKTAIVEREALGGICLNWGCIPTKALLKSGEVYEQLGHLADYGLSVEKRGLRLRQGDRALAQGRRPAQRRRRLPDEEAQDRGGRGDRAGWRRARARPTWSWRSRPAATRTLTAKHVILATGARARTIPAIGLEPDGERVWTYREALVPKAAPKSLIVIGSGAIGIEFASFYRALGADVTVIEALPRILPVEDEEVSGRRPQGLREARPEVPRRRAKVKKLTKTKTGVAVEIEVGGKAETLEADVAIVAVGIVGNVEDLGLEALGVKIDRGHVVTDGHGATNVAGLYAIGDVAGPPWLAHKASHEGVHCVEHIAGLQADEPRPRRSPAAPIPTPQIASVGLTEAQAKEQGLRGQGRPLPVPGERQGHRRRRDRGLRQDRVRRQDRRPDRRAHDRRRGHRDDPGLRPGHDAGGHRGRAAAPPSSRTRP